MRYNTQNSTLEEQDSLKVHDPVLFKSANHLRLLTGLDISILSIEKANLPYFDDNIAKILINGEPETLWRDWESVEHNVYWLENLDVSGTLVSLVKKLKEAFEDDINEKLVLARRKKTKTVY